MINDREKECVVSSPFCTCAAQRLTYLHSCSRTTRAHEPGIAFACLLAAQRAVLDALLLLSMLLLLFVLLLLLFVLLLLLLLLLLVLCCSCCCCAGPHTHPSCASVRYACYCTVRGTTCGTNQPSRTWAPPQQQTHIAASAAARFFVPPWGHYGEGLSFRGCPCFGQLFGNFDEDALYI